MANRIALTRLNASTIDILNVIRQNASAEYQDKVPKVTKLEDIPKVGEVIWGDPAFSNQFLNALINRIAFVQVRSATFNNAYAELKKGYLEFGETVEEVFISICKAREFNVEKADEREFKRYLPDVRAAFHTINYKVMYPITIQDDDLRQAFLSAEGVQDMIAKIISSVVTAQEYDEYLLFKYLLIKAITKGKLYTVAFDSSDIKNASKKFRGISNMLEFMKNSYNESGVTTVTSKADQYIFMDAMFNAEYDVDVLASAFNMDKATFSGKLKLIDDWTTFDNERFAVIRENSDQLEEVTDEELALMANVKAVLVDKEWFQIYDNKNKITNTQVSSGDYWNYFFHVWKTVSHSPFSNAVVFVDDAASIVLPSTLTVKITAKDTGDMATVLTLGVDESDTVAYGNVEFVQSEALVTDGIAVHKYGALLIPTAKAATEITLVAVVGGTTYTGATTINASSEVGTSVTMNKSE